MTAKRKRKSKPTTASWTSLSVTAAAKVLSKAVRRPIKAATIRHDIKNGAPKNRDGTINLINYTAWLARELTSRGA